MRWICCGSFPAEKKQALAAHLDDDTRKDVRRLLAFHQEEIGSRMSGNFVCIPGHTDRLRRHERAGAAGR